MDTIKKILLGISAFFTGIFATTTILLLVEEGFDAVILGLFGLFAWLFMIQINKIKQINSNRDIIRSDAYEDAYRKGRDMVNRAYDEKLSKMNDAEMKEAIKTSLEESVTQDEIDPQELQEMLSGKENQTSTQKAE